MQQPRFSIARGAAGRAVAAAALGAEARARAETAAGRDRVDDEARADLRSSSDREPAAPAASPSPRRQLIDYRASGWRAIG